MPDTGLLVKPPEITTFRPAVEGSGEDPTDSAPFVHGVVQQVVDVQHVEPVQQVVPAGQHAVVGNGQQTTLEVLAFVGPGQHVGLTFGCARSSGQMMWGTLLCATLPAAPAGPAAKTITEMARKRSDDGKIRRRIAETRHTCTRICEA